MGWHVEQVRASEVKVGDVVQTIEGRGNWYEVTEIKPDAVIQGTVTIRFNTGSKSGYTENVIAHNLVNKQVSDG